ncbi:MAG: BMP family ABC transporter substrate-binding protein [Nitrososphaera sp.]|nr:BMP family ABC transporter substrate-binding protein [Nitrososphaera sp.]
MKFARVANLITLTITAVLLLTLLSFDNVQAADTKLKVGFITNGPVSDWGYNYAHNQGRLLLENELREQVQTTIAENVPETADAERVMERMIRSGIGLIIATSFGYQDTVYKLARKYPKVQFAQAWGFKSRPNMGSYSAKMYEAWYVMGIVAGMTTKTNKLGVVAAHPIPPMKWQINAYVLGARSVNPKVTASVVFINHWFDATLASEATASLIEQGADIVIGVLDSSVAVAQTAEKKEAYLIGHNADLARFAPTRILTGTEWLWGNLYVDVARDVLAKKPLGGKHYTGGLAEKYVGFTAFSSLVPEPVRKAADEMAEKIRTGHKAIYAGPVKDNKGNLKVKEGEVLTHEQVMGMDWLVEGVQ